MLRALVPVLLLVLAGCVTPAGTPEGVVTPQDEVIPAFPQEHDHGDPALHDHRDGLRLMGSHTLAPDGGARGDWMTSEIIVRGQHAYVAYAGAPWVLAVVDLADPTAPALVGQLPYANAWGMDVAVSEDGDWAFVAIYPAAVGELFAPGYALSHVAPPNAPAGPGVAVVDVRDRAAPRLSSFFPTHGLGPHTLMYHKHADGRELVFLERADLDFGNLVYITELVTLPTGDRVVRPLATWRAPDPVDQNQPHDIDVQQHPITGQTLMYVAYTFAGIYVVDVTDPSLPQQIAHTADGPEGPDALMHDIHPYPHLVDGRHFTLAAPEIITGETTGTLRIYDTTDPTAPTLVGTWRVPGEYVVEEPFGFSAHNFQFMPDGRVAIAHGHAGVWLVDWLTTRGVQPHATAYYAAAFPGAVPPDWRPVHGTPWYWGTAIDDRGILWASDAMGGIVSLAEEPRAPRTTTS